VTGANTGLGLETARNFTRLGAANIILAVWFIGKGEMAKLSIEGSTNTHGIIDVWLLDAADYGPIKEFVRRTQGLARVDALVANTGVST